MNKPLALALFVGGSIFVTYGVSASDAMGSGFSRLFSRAPTSHTIWMTVGGGAAAATGLAGMLRGAHSNFLAANRHARLRPRLLEVPHDPFGSLPEEGVNRPPVSVSVPPGNHANSTHPNSHEK